MWGQGVGLGALCAGSSPQSPRQLQIYLCHLWTLPCLLTVHLPTVDMDFGPGDCGPHCSFPPLPLCLPWSQTCLAQGTPVFSGVASATSDPSLPLCAVFPGLFCVLTSWVGGGLSLTSDTGYPSHRSQQVSTTAAPPPQSSLPVMLLCRPPRLTQPLCWLAFSFLFFSYFCNY